MAQKSESAKRKIKLLQSIAGHRPNGAQFAFNIGAVIDWDANEAERFVDRGIAEYVEQKTA